MAEWFKAAVLKTVEPSGSGGSNPSLSAKYMSSTGELAERSKATAWKAVIVMMQGFESLILRKEKHPKAEWGAVAALDKRGF